MFSSETFLKKFQKKLKINFPFQKMKKMFCFHVYGQILKFFQAYLHKNKNYIFLMF
jgi:hypothetical protein